MSFLATVFGAKRGHAALFNELCKLHNIDKPTRALLERIITAYNVEKPAMFFYDPAFLRQAIADAQFSKEKDTLRELCYRWHSIRV